MWAVEAMKGMAVSADRPPVLARIIHPPVRTRGRSSSVMDRRAVEVGMPQKSVRVEPHAGTVRALGAHVAVAARTWASACTPDGLPPRMAESYVDSGQANDRAAARNISRAGKHAGKRTRMRRADCVMMAATLSSRMRSVSNCI
jgi:hypothetical protein